MCVLFGAINGLCSAVAGASPPAARPRSQRAAPDQLRLPAAPCARGGFLRVAGPSRRGRLGGSTVSWYRMWSIVVRQKHNTQAKVVRLEIVLYA